MELSTRVKTIKKKNKPVYVIDKSGVTIDTELLLTHRKEKFAHIRIEKKDHGPFEKLILYIDRLVFKEWIINKETRIITKTLDYFG